MKNFKYNYPPWFDRNLRTLIKEKRIAHTEYKNNHSQTSYMKFSELRSKCKYFSKRCRNQYLSNVQNNLTTNPRGFWKYMKNKRNNNELPTIMYYNNERYEK